MVKWFLLKEPLRLAWALLNHRGSSMNLRFQLIHRVSTREFLSITSKTRVNLRYYAKNNRKEKIQEAFILI